MVRSSVPFLPKNARLGHDTDDVVESLVKLGNLLRQGDQARGHGAMTPDPPFSRGMGWPRLAFFARIRLMIRLALWQALPKVSVTAFSIPTQMQDPLPVSPGIRTG